MALNGPNEQNLRPVEVPAEVRELTDARLITVDFSINGLAENPSIKAGEQLKLAEVITLPTRETQPAAETQTQYFGPHDLTADEARQVIDRIA